MRSAYFDYFSAVFGGINLVFRRLSEADANRVLGHIATIRPELEMGAGSVGD